MSQVYRPDIDGLRAFSVLAVILFHLGLTNVAAGGFIGVDVFFVISGYLIAGQIYLRLQSDRGGLLPFLGWFYGRRVRRILPAFLFVSALTFVAAYFLFLPDRFEQFAWSLLASLGFSANIYFWLTSDYFAAAALTKPLLHYWSLGVEEHFYLFFPILMFVIWRFGWRVIATVMLTLFVASLIASQIMLSVRQESAFYLIQYRAWELLAGSLLAIPAVRSPRSETIAALACLLGIGLLGYSIFGTSEAAFPGLSAVPPVLAAVLLLWGGQRPNAVSRIIGNNALRYIGLISYSLYLVHWPIIVFVKQAFPNLTVLELSAVVLAASFALAAFSYRFVERPTRRRSEIWTGPRIAALAGCGATVSGALAAAVISTHGYAARLPPDVRDLLAKTYDHREGYREGVCFLRPEQSFENIDETTCLPTGPRTALLWGDSFAAHYVPGLKPQLESLGYTFAQANASLCAPIIGRENPQRPHCRAFNDSVFDWIRKTRPAVVILSAAWPIDAASLKQLDESLAQLETVSGVKTVVLGQSPLYRDAVPAIIAERWLRGEKSEYSLTDLAPWAFSIDAAVSAVVSAKKGIGYVSVMKAACPSKSCRLYDGEPFHFDHGHMTAHGSAYISKAILPYLEEVIR
ncbi:MAG: acyltransferase family protein [Pseudomonadota bacterium]